MSQQTFTATAGTWGTGLGLLIPREVRDNVFKSNWETIQLQIDGTPVSINLTPSFWSTCHELRSPHIGEWLKSRGMDKWKRGNPPKFKVKQVDGNKFEIIGRA